MNLLIPLLTPSVPEAQELPPDERMVIDDLLTSVILQPTEAEPGSLCLLEYDDALWGAFASQAQETDGPPSSTFIAVAGLRRGERWVAVPDLPLEQPFLAMWRIGAEETLQVGIADLRETGTAIDEVIDVLRRTPDSFDQPELNIPCENRTSDLACANRGCNPGSCVEYSWFDPGRGVRLYSCVCVSR
jgi:hypothetical protein